MRRPSQSPAPTARWIVAAYLADGSVVTEHATKRAAELYGTTLRREGVDAFVFSSAHAAQFGLDPRVAS